MKDILLPFDNYCLFYNKKFSVTVYALLIVVLANVVTTFTTLSMSAVATNGRIQAGMYTLKMFAKYILLLDSAHFQNLKYFLQLYLNRKGFTWIEF